MDKCSFREGGKKGRERQRVIGRRGKEIGSEGDGRRGGGGGSEGEVQDSRRSCVNHEVIQWMINKSFNHTSIHSK